MLLNSLVLSLLSTSPFLCLGLFLVRLEGKRLSLAFSGRQHIPLRRT